MKVLIDTNIILDVLCNRKEFVDDSLKIFKLCEIKKITGYISTLSIANIVYIMRKELDSKMVKDILEKLTLIFEIVEFCKKLNHLHKLFFYIVLVLFFLIGFVAFLLNTKGNSKKNGTINFDRKIYD